uniref:WD repeat-containing protein 88-like n=1 Tax=Sparus aurata TaxID=8175 RepID=A0A671UKM2_SPAAU
MSWKCGSRADVATVSADRSIKLWDLLAQKTTESIESNHSNVVSDCCFSTSAHFLCTASWDKSLKLWDLQEGGFRSHGGTKLQRGHEGSVSSCSLSADANLLVSGSYDKTVALWDVSLLCQTLILKGHSDWVTDVSVSADGKLVASASKFTSSRSESNSPSAFVCTQLLTQCVFCRLKSPSRYRPQPPPLM